MVYMSLSFYTSLGTYTGTKWMHTTTLSRYGTYKKRFTSNFDQLPKFYAFNTIKLRLNYEHLTIKYHRLFMRVTDAL